MARQTKGRGRPTLREERMDTVLRLRIPPGMRSALTDAAEAEGLSDSEYVRRLLEDRLAIRTNPRPKKKMTSKRAKAKKT